MSKIIGELRPGGSVGIGVDIVVVGGAGRAASGVNGHSALCFKMMSSSATKPSPVSPCTT